LGRAPERVGEANLFTLLRHLDFAPLWHPILKRYLSAAFRSPRYPVQSFMY
jgi:hypothetical protein